ncbi:N-acyl-D-amino-acid deacylase family protein [Pseudonocardia kunmingensis]|uniref:Dihydroorotase n=1 Tax=Pseudonocardia kunmingensis TaxID=630975 RepID=A0A543DPN4_9PSEU|nr:amidohydrolase family protein [Pseudonocardia kunmingensis]TQM11263.1 dihydroorotase [Pseudonocardia kunmingensis]
MTTSYDLVIRRGTVADGSGGELFEADVAVRDGTVAAVGPDLAAGTEEIDATGLLVTPGYVDIHTHYDGQVTWENRLSPSSGHGVTTVVTGNCGVGFAPCRPEDQTELVELMAGVEDIPEVVMTEGLSWTWTTFPEYLDTVARRPHDIDVAAMVPHSALRVYAMGRRAIERESATEGEIARMGELMREAMAAGAIGFGTSRALQQKSVHGEPIPTVRAAEDELRGILLAMAEGGGGVFQALSDFDEFADVDGEFAMFRRLVTGSGRPLSFTLNQKHRDPDGWRRLLELTAEASAEGLPITAQVLGRPTGLLLGHDVTLSPFSRCPSYAALADLPLDARVRELRRSEVRRRVLVEAAGHNRRAWRFRFELGDPPNYEPDPTDSLEARAAREGTTPEALAYDLLLTGDGRGLLFEAFQNYADGSLQAAYEMMVHPDTVLGLGDGGAHLGLICDASYPTTMLAHWTRDRTRGPRMSIPAAVKAMTSDTARAVGLHDRGRIAPGCKADVNVIDYDRLRLHRPEVVRDLPAGGRRIVQRADGYVATLVSGTVTYRGGAPTGALPGRLVRGPRHAPSADVR